MTKQALRSGQGSDAFLSITHSIVACLDLVRKVINFEGVPSSTKNDGDLLGQLCMDFSHSIRDQINENWERERICIEQMEREFWEKYSPSVRNAYLRSDRAINTDREYERIHYASIEYVRWFRPDEELMQDAEFRRMWEAVAPNQNMAEYSDLSRELERFADRMVGVSTAEFLASRSALGKAKVIERSSVKSAYVREMCRVAKARYDSLYALDHIQMLEQSDVVPRLALGADLEWVGRFWKTAGTFARNRKKFQPETFLLREGGLAQTLLDRELARAGAENRKANRDSALDEWVRTYGVQRGVVPEKIDWNTLQKYCERQDARVDAWLRRHSGRGLVAWLTGDRTMQYLGLERAVRSDLMKTDNGYSALTERLTSSVGPVTYVGDLIGNVFSSQAHLMGRLRRFMSIRNLGVHKLKED